MSNQEVDLLLFENFKLINPNTPYAVSTQAAIWDKDKLLDYVSYYYEVGMHYTKDQENKII